MPKPPSNPLWQIIDAVAIVFSRAYMLARTRAVSCPSPVLRMMARRDHTHWEARMLERELAICRDQRTRLAPTTDLITPPNNGPISSGLCGCAAGRPSR